MCLLIKGIDNALILFVQQAALLKKKDHEIPQLPLDHPQLQAIALSCISSKEFSDARFRIYFGRLSPNELHNTQNEKSTHLYQAANNRDLLWIMEIIRLGYGSSIHVSFIFTSIFYAELPSITWVQQATLPLLEYAFNLMLVI